MAGDMQEHYRNLGYTIMYDGGVQYYYVALRTHRRTGAKQICLCGNFAYSNMLHDPARAMQAMPQDKDYVYSRMGPFPTRSQAEADAARMATDLFHDPTRFGLFGTGGVADIDEMRQPAFW